MLVNILLLIFSTNSDLVRIFKWKMLFNYSMSRYGVQVDLLIHHYLTYFFAETIFVL